jgi:FkbM family methyltransferase
MTAPLAAVDCPGHHFRVSDFQAEFWARVSRGEWEPETFKLLDHCVTPETVFLDVGSWIGPTLLYAAGRARLSLGFEPDPTAFRALAANVALNPHLNPIRLFSSAISAHRGKTLMGSASTPGDSMSSLLFAGSAASWPVELRRIEDYESELPADAPLFLKIDIEGGEYDLLPALADFIRRRRPTVYLSLHPYFFIKPWHGRGRWAQARGELSLLLKTCRAAVVAAQFSHLYDPAGGRLQPVDLLRRQRWLHATGLVMSHRSIPYLEHPGGTSSGPTIH